MKSWLLVITLNHCRARMRKKAWKALVFRDIAESELVSSENSPEQHTADREFAAQLTKLPYTYREVIILHYYHDLSVNQISTYLQLKEGTVKSRLARGRALLKNILEEGAQHHEAE